MVVFCVCDVVNCKSIHRPVGVRHICLVEDSYLLLLVTTVLEDKTHKHDTNVSLAISKTVHQLPLLCKTFELDRINTIIITYYYYCHHRLHHHHQNYCHYCHSY